MASPNISVPLYSRLLLQYTVFQLSYNFAVVFSPRSYDWCRFLLLFYRHVLLIIAEFCCCVYTIQLLLYCQHVLPRCVILLCGVCTLQIVSEFYCHVVCTVFQLLHIFFAFSALSSNHSGYLLLCYLHCHPIIVDICCSFICTVTQS